ncbi:MAG: GNAT family N-acetyltransferase [Ruminococcus sp.]|nr:GNAT family N-acetyltransferase [Ruminococcus sp.]
MIQLREANFEDIEAEWLLVRDMPENENGYVNPYHCIGRQAFDKALYEMIEWSCGIGIPKGYVPDTTLFIWNDLDLIGQARIRHRLTEALRRGSGHIGFWIAPQFRGRGYGTEALRQILDRAEGMVPEEELYLRVDKDNAASLRIIIKNGGRIEAEDGKTYFLRVGRRTGKDH